MSLNQILRNDANPVGIYDVRLKTVECKTLLAEALTIVNLNVTNLTATGSIVGHSGEFVARVGAGIGRQVGNAEIFAITEDKDPSVPAFLNLRKIGDDENQYKVEVKDLSTTITAIRPITETVTGNKTETINGNKTETVTGISTETITTVKVMNAPRFWLNNTITYPYSSPAFVQDSVDKFKWTADAKSSTAIRITINPVKDYEWKTGADIQVALTGLPSEFSFGLPVISYLTVFDSSTTSTFYTILLVGFTSPSNTAKTFFFRNIGNTIPLETTPANTVLRAFVTLSIRV